MLVGTWRSPYAALFSPGEDVQGHAEVFLQVLLGGSHKEFCFVLCSETCMNAEQTRNELWQVDKK